MLDWKQVGGTEKNPLFMTNVNGAKVKIRLRFAKAHNPNLKNNIIEILTSCYEKRMESFLSSNGIQN